MLAMPVDDAQRRVIAAGELYHVTKFSSLEGIVTNADNRRPLRGPYDVYLRSGHGWSVFPFRILRDYSVLDTAIGDTDFHGRYLYFFLGEPTEWGRRKNIGLMVSEAKAQREYGVIRIAGSALLAQAGHHVFYRADDNAVVVRGEYRGPAIIGWDN
jgi:hypothetical protein